MPYIALSVCNVCISTSFTYLFDISNSDFSAFLFVLQFYLFPYASNKPVEVLNTSSESWSLGKSLVGHQGISRQPRTEQYIFLQSDLQVRLGTMKAYNQYLRNYNNYINYRVPKTMDELIE